jgi:hypothetical protein
MRLLETGLAAVLGATMIATLTARVSAQAAAEFEAYRTVCAQQGAAFMSDLREELKARSQPAWTAADERKRLDSYLRDAAANADQRKEFESAFAEVWGQSTDFMERTELLVGACAVTVANAWDAGVREPEQIR